ncbi:MAG: FAD-dependent oxidoreductase [Candidatus Bathyarchaeota archaeon]|nr:FAD-dependent oxidoreductase [Candidatus Bathyarchaeum sp.]
MLFEALVDDIIQRTHNVKSYRFSYPSSFSYEAGQFLFITLEKGKEKLKKPFTISSSPTEEFIEFTKKLTGHQFSNMLDSFQVGDCMKIDAPYGKLVLDKQQKKIGMLSGGIGITPLRSICRYATDLHLETNIILLYGNETYEDIVFRQELKQMEKENENLKVVHVLNKPPSNWDGYTGYINAEVIQKEIPDYKKRVFYTCGPPGMVKAMMKLLHDLDVQNKQMKIENFAGY